METTHLVAFTALFIINALSLFGNALMLVVGVRCKKLRQHQNTFIFNMAFADLTQALFIMPTALICVNADAWIFGESTCHVFAIARLTTNLVSIYSLAGIGVQRYFFVVRHTKRTQSAKVAGVAVAGVWTLALFLATTPLYGWGEFGFDDGKHICTVIYRKSVSHTLVLGVTGLLFNVIVVIFCYVSIYRMLSVNIPNRQVVTAKMEKKISSNVSPTGGQEDKNPEDKRQQQNEGEYTGYRSVIPVLSFEPEPSSPPRKLSSAAGYLSSSRNTYYLQPLSVGSPGGRSNLSVEQFSSSYGTSSSYHVSSTSSGGFSILSADSTTYLDRQISVSPDTSVSSVDGSPSSKLNGLFDISSDLGTVLEKRPKSTVDGQQKNQRARANSVRSVKNWVINKIPERREFNVSSKELHLLKIISIVIVVFIICWAPYGLFTLYKTFSDDDVIVASTTTVDTVTTWLAFLNGALNPVIYGVLNKQFNTAMKNVLRCRKV